MMSVLSAFREKTRPKKKKLKIGSKGEKLSFESWSNNRASGSVAELSKASVNV